MGWHLFYATVLVGMLTTCAAKAIPQDDARTSLSGSVHDSESGAPLPECTVRLELPLRIALTDSAGTFVLHDLPAGNKCFCIRGAHYRPDSLRIHLAAGVSNTVRITLRREEAQSFIANGIAGEPPSHNPGAVGHLLVRVRDLEGNALPGAYAVVLSNGLRLGGWADSLGHFLLPHVSPGPHEVIVHSAAHEGYSAVRSFQDSVPETLDVRLDVLPEARGRTVVMSKDGNATVGDYLYGSDGSKWIICRNIKSTYRN